jgi:microcin C transport system ATP-binding protein
LLYDEPTTGLDPVTVRGVNELTLELQSRLGVTSIVITHDMDVIQAMAHQVLVLKDGEVVEQGSREAVFSTPQHPYTLALLAASGH